MKNDYIPTIGIECHVQLNTRSKLFSGASNDARTAEPNTLVNHIDFGLPGALPVLNHQALILAVKAALVLKTKPQLFSTFDRKHYFYPDLPMGYQITQYDQPIIVGGQVEFKANDVIKRVGITRAHLEADAGKSTHPSGQSYSLVDLNRAGTPLLEIVSEPDMHSASEAKAYAKELYLLMRYSGVSEADLYHGNMRFDVNVSVSKSDKLGTRSETKNLNSFRSVEKAVEYEIKRQVELLKNGGTVAQETRGWDESKQKSVTQRSKENADDYRYMPDPDLPPVQLNEELIKQIEQDMPRLPDYWRAKLTKLGLSEEQIETLIEANLDRPEAAYLELLDKFADPKQLANWLVNIDIPITSAAQVKSKTDRHELYSGVLALTKANKISSTNAKDLINRVLTYASLVTNIEQFAKEQNLLQQSDEAVLGDIVKQVLQANPKASSDIKSGETKAIGFLIGQVMIKTNNQANPVVVHQLIDELLKS